MGSTSVDTAFEPSHATATPSRLRLLVPGLAAVLSTGLGLLLALPLDVSPLLAAAGAAGYFCAVVAIGTFVLKVSRVLG